MTLKTTLMEQAIQQETEEAPKFLFGAPEGQDARILAAHAEALAKERRVLVHVALDDARVATLKDLLAFFAPKVEVLEFPAWDCLPYDRVSPGHDIVGRRVHALCTLLAWKEEQKYLPRIVLTTVNALLQRVTPRRSLENSSFLIQAGGKLDMAAFQTYLAGNGYLRTETVREAGEFAVRGGIVDLFSPSEDIPVRIDLFGDEVESLRSFDAVTQRTQAKLERFSLRPVTEFFLDEAHIRTFRAGYRNAFGTQQKDDPLYEAVSEGRRYNGMEHWLPLFFDGLESLSDYLPEAAMTQDQHVARSASERLSQIQDFYEARKTLEAAAACKGKKKGADVSLTGAVYHPLAPEKLYLKAEEWAGISTQAETLMPFSGPEEEGGASRGRDFADIRALPEGDVFAALKDHISSLQRKTLIACYSEGSKERLKGMLDHAGVSGPALCVLPLEHGFVAPDLAVITEADILGDRLSRRSARRKKADNFLTEVSSLDVGDLVVHIDHGVGRFDGLETLAVGRAVHDCLKITYAGQDRLFVPVENIEVLTRFGSDEGAAQLDRLGGAGLQARKAKVKKDLMAMADGLLEIAAARQLREGEKLDVDKDMYERFAARFPYQETEDQQRSINDVLADLSGGRPMDRLVCGDVGFGKTEVALRAAYVAAMAGVQVALAVPTTLLARQHFAGFMQRFAGTGLRVAQLSRMVNAKDARAVKEGLADGRVNIVIGTHALFAKEIKFAHLGLVIVDEEQRFGVKQKERLKELRSDVHVLTLTATPIPRTLQMSLSGVKDMSLITTPPVDRLAIRTFVLPFDDMVIREALLREHYRGGQSFYVCPRVKDIHDVEAQLKELVPEVKVIAAHGQMSPRDLEDRMSAFYDGQYDVLLATNIIESGIDIPTANTMVVHRADLFGLAQLYQIRGRIGRSKMRAYAYLTYDPAKILSAQAQKRLEVIETLDTLGAGFQLASHDMDIRGAGNLLGEAQSGHIREVGVELYQQMLEEAVSAAKAGVDLTDAPEEGGWSPQINVGTSVLIPENYVEDLGIRMSLYRRLGGVETKEEIEGFAAELIDRFGKLPEEVENLLDIAQIKQLCRAAGVDKVEAGPKGAVVSFYRDTPPNVPGLMKWVNSYSGSFKLRHDQKIVAVREWGSARERVGGVKSLMRDLAELAKTGDA